MKFFSRKKNQKGFTLIEMVIAVPLFLVIATAAGAAYLNIAQVNRAAKASRTAIDNLSVVVEDMTRTIKTGSTFYCFNGAGVTTAYPTPTPADCTGGNRAIAFLDQQGNRIVYYVDASTGNLYKRWYYKDINSGLYNQSNNPSVLLSNTQFTITNPSKVFYVRGAAAAPTNLEQPHILINLQGTVTVSGITKSFDFQTMVTQRSYDG